MSIIVDPEKPIAYDPENRVKWSEIAPSLQERFLAIGKLMDSNMQGINDLSNNIRLTIGYDPPMHPEEDRDLWWDLNYDVLRFYMSKNNDGNYRWEYTRGAWYGGSSSDVRSEVIPAPQTEYVKVKTLCWISNVAKNNTFSTVENVERSLYYTAPVAGTYKIEDNCNLFAYNAQAKYTHDGGRIDLAINHSVKANNYANTQIYSAIYDSKTTYRARDAQGFLPSKTITLAQGDRILFNVTTERNPQSTDDVEIYQIASVNIFRKVR